MNYDDFIALVKSRTSCRSYSPQAVPDEIIEKCLEAARLAPSACNKQPWRFIVVNSRDTLAEICSDGLLPGLPMPWLKSAPVIIVLGAEKSFFTHKLFSMVSGVNYHYLDLGIAGEHLVLAAESLGLQTCWIGWFKIGKIRKILNLPRSIEIVSLLSLGYPLKKTEPGNRFEINEITFWNTWNLKKN